MAINAIIRSGYRKPNNLQLARNKNKFKEQPYLSITETMKTTPTIIIQVVLSLMPLDIYIKGVALVAMSRLCMVKAAADEGSGKARRRF